MMKNKSRVFLVQEISNRRIDLSDAEKYGTLVPILNDDKAGIYNTRLIHKQIEESLRDFSDEDYLLCMGDPIAIGIAFHVAARNNNGKVNSLRWDRDEAKYHLIPLDTR